MSCKDCVYDKDCITVHPEDGEGCCEFKPRWIPISERLPEERHSVLVYCPEYRNIFCAYYYKDAWLFFGGRHERIDEKVSHWMVLPESPIEDGGDGDDG